MGYLDCEYNAVGRDKAGIIVRNNGSTVMAVVSGPFEPAGPILNIYAGTIRITIAGDSLNKSEFGSMQEALEIVLSKLVYLRDYPRSIIDVKIFVLEKSDSVISAIINALSIAIMNSGIQMKGVLLGIHDRSSNSTIAYAYANQKYHKVFQIGNYTENEPDKETELNDLIERIVYSLKKDYRRDWLAV